MKLNQKWCLKFFEGVGLKIDIYRDKKFDTNQPARFLMEYPSQKHVITFLGCIRRYHVPPNIRKLFIVIWCNRTVCDEVQSILDMYFSRGKPLVQYPFLKRLHQFWTPYYETKDDFLHSETMLKFVKECRYRLNGSHIDNRIRQYSKLCANELTNFLVTMQQSRYRKNLFDFRFHFQKTIDETNSYFRILIEKQ